MNYLQYFELACDPFSNAPDARFYYDSQQHRQAEIKLLHAVDSNRGLGVLLGGIGSGKTTLARRILDRLPPEKYETSLLVMVHGGLSPQWILQRIALQLGVAEPADDRLTLLKQLYDLLVELDEAGRRAVVLIDEAQMLSSRSLMEEFRGLLNLEVPGKKLLNILFFGLPEFSDCLALDPPLAQRVAVHLHLQPFPAEVTTAYVNHRLQIAGANRALFDAEALALIQKYSHGVPRLINTLCDNALFEAYMQRRSQVDAAMIHAVAGDLGLLLSTGESMAPVTRETEQPQVDATELEDIEALLRRLEDGA